MKTLFKVCLLLICSAILSGQQAQATHLMGGNLAYEYLGVNSSTGLYEYRVSITIYRYCAAGSSTLPTSLDIGVYEDDSGNPTGDKQLVITSNLPLLAITPITPPNANDTCTFTPNVCVEEGYYEAVLAIPSNNTGYYFLSDRCCRNNNIANLFDPGNTGQAYFAFAPPPSTVNSSPTFAVPPVPFLCSSDTVSILNQAFDPDGDLLVYHFVVPYNGISGPGNPNPNPPPMYPWPIPNVVYNPTFSVTDPFGPGGYASIDTATGLASYYAPNQGFYVLAVEIEEYRNGVLIGLTRRDLQIIVIPCPINPAPVLAGSNQVNYIISEGQTLCFNVDFSDPNGDSIYISHTGDIFDPLIINPAATFTDSSGAGNATGIFCWTPSCGQGSTVPYNFSVSATDNGCPAKITNIVYSITVVNTPAPAFLNGPDTVCFSAANGIQYTVPNSIGNTHGWNVTNGTITGSQTGTTITVNFTAPGVATVSAYTVNAYGCMSDTISKNVFIVPLPTATAGPDKQICSGTSVIIGGVSTPGMTYSWSPATGLSSTTVAAPTVTLTNGGPGPLVITYTVTVTLNGCTNTDSVVVTVNPIPVAAAGPDVHFCSGSSATLGTTNTPGQTYSWSPATGLSSTTISNPTVTLTNSSGVTDTLVYFVQVQSAAGCQDIDTVVVFVDPAPVAQAGTDVTFCGGLSASLGTATTPGYGYTWSPSTGLSNSTISNPTVTLINTSSINDTVVYVVTTTLGNCTDTDSVLVIVLPSPVSNAGPDLVVCSGTTVQLGTSTTPGYVYTWTPATGLDNATISDPTLTLPPVGSTPDTLVFVVTTTLNGCVTSDTVTIISGPAPVANAGSNKAFCSGNTVTIGVAAVPGYNYSWSPTTGLSNPNASNPTVTLTNTTTVNDTIFYIVTASLFGCIDSDTVRVIVRPRPISNAGPNQQLICAGDSVQLGTGVTPGYTYSWSPATGLNDSTISDPILILNNTGTTPDTLYYVVTTVLGGCTSTDTVQVISAPAAVANAGPNRQFCSGDSATIGTAAVPGYVYSWSPTTGLSSATGANPTVTLFNTSGVNDTIFYVITANLFGCLDEDTVRVIVHSAPISDAGADQLICAGSSVQLGTSTTPGYSYSWSPATGLSGTAISDPTLTLNNTDTIPDTLTYIVTTTLNGCISTDTVQVISAPQPDANAGTDVVICSGETANLGSAGTTGYVYTWLPGTGLSSSAIPAPTVTLTNSTSVNDTVMYVVNVDAFGCLDADTVLVIVKPLPVSNAGPNTTLCGGDTLVLGTSVTPGYSYSWTPGTGLSDSTISDPVLIVNNNGAGSTTLTFVVTTTWNGCTSTDTVTITVDPQPNVTAAANPQSICLGASATLTGSGATTYNWAELTSPGISIGTGGTLTVTPTITTSYIVTGTNGFSCSNQDTVTVTVNPLPLVQIVAAPDSICDGDTLILNATGASTYTWTDPIGTVLGTGPSLTVTPTTNSTYIVTGTDGNSCTNSDTVSVVVNPAPTLTAITGNISVCPGVVGVPYWVINPNPNSTYTWTVTNGTVVFGQGTDSILVDWSSTAGTGVISVVEITDLGCQSAVPVILNVSVNVILTPVAPTGPILFCANEAQGIIYSTLFTPGSTYNWVAVGGNIVSGNGTAIVTVDWTAPGPQTVYLYYDETSTTSTNICFGTSDTLEITINPAPNTSAIAGNANVCVGDSGAFSVTNTAGSTYAWNVIGGTMTGGNGTNSITVNYSTTGTAVVQVVETNSYGCIGDTVSLNVTVNGLPAANAGPDVGVCLGQSVQLNATGGTGYSWTPGTGLSNTLIPNPLASPVNSTTYTVFVTDANGCQNSDSVLVTVNPLPVITVTPASSICFGSSILLNASGGNTYQWSPAGSLDNPGSPSPNANPTVNTTYTVVVTDGNGCVDSATVDITVNPLPIAQAGPDTLICEGTSVTLSGSGGISFVWSPPQSLNNPNIANPVATPPVPTTYTVTVTDANGCTDDDEMSVNLNDAPLASFLVDLNVISANCNGIEATLLNTSQDATNYLWQFPNGSTSTDVNPVYHFDFNSTVVTLIAYNNFCTDTSQQNFTGGLLDIVFKNINNVFSPNGDDKNECFDFGKQYDFKECSSIKVFNRWGTKVFDATPSNHCWNGKKDNTGAEMPTGTYYMSVQIAGHKYSGTITLIR